MVIRILSMACLWLAGQAVVASSPASGDKARVLVVNSHGSGRVCGRPQGEGVARVLAEGGWVRGQNLDLRSVCRDAKNVSTMPDTISQRARLALEEVDAFEPHILVVLDDNAVREVTVGRADAHDVSIPEPLLTAADAIYRPAGEDTDAAISRR